MIDKVEEKKRYLARERESDLRQRRIESAAAQAVRQRNHRRARDRALVRLSRLYPADYRKLYEEERARDQAENKTWLDIHGRTNGGLNTPGRPARGASNAGSKQASDIREPESYLGGEA